MYVDVEKWVSTLQEDSLITTQNDETILSTIGVDAENGFSFVKRVFHNNAKR